MHRQCCRVVNGHTTALEMESFFQNVRPSPPGSLPFGEETVRGRSNQFYGPQSPGNPRLAVPPALKLWQESIPLHPSGRSQGVVRRAFLGAPEASTTGARAFWGPDADDERCAALFHRGVGCRNAFLISL